MKDKEQMSVNLTRYEINTIIGTLHNRKMGFVNNNKNPDKEYLVFLSSLILKFQRLGEPLTYIKAKGRTRWPKLLWDRIPKQTKTHIAYIMVMVAILCIIGLIAPLLERY